MTTTNKKNNVEVVILLSFERREDKRMIKGDLAADLWSV